MHLRIKSVSKTEVVFVSRLDAQERTYTLIKGTSIQDADGNALTTKALTPDVQALVIGQETSAGKLEAKVIKTLTTATSSPTTR